MLTARAKAYGRASYGLLGPCVKYNAYTWMESPPCRSQVAAMQASTMRAYRMSSLLMVRAWELVEDLLREIAHILSPASAVEAIPHLLRDDQQAW
jgi:hypothetical protein